MHNIDFMLREHVCLSGEIFLHNLRKNYQLLEMYVTSGISSYFSMYPMD